MRRVFRACQRLVAVVMCAGAGCVSAQMQTKLDLSTLDYQLKARELAPDVFVVEGANADFSPANGCNIINTGFIVTGAGVVVINTGPSRLYGQQLRDLIARTSKQPVVKVIHLNLHPDYFLGNQAFADVPRAATPITRAGMKREAGAYADNLYRLCGEWMKGTEPLLPSVDLSVGVERIGTHDLETLELSGHTDSDVVLIDRTRGVMFADHAACASGRVVEQLANLVKNRANCQFGAGAQPRRGGAQHAGHRAHTALHELAGHLVSRRCRARFGDERSAAHAGAARVQNLGRV
jgi:hypothetical protein